MAPLAAQVPAAPVPAAAAVAVVQRSNPAPHGWVTHVVRPGDTVADLALRYRTSTSTIIARNHLRHGGSFLQVGQRLSVPRTAAMAAQERARAKAARARAAATRAAAIRAATYVVRPGDTLSGIAAKRGVSLATVLKVNHLRLTSTIYVGQRLHVAPGRSATKARASRTPSTTAYTVRSGDTLGAIAQRTRTSLATILRLNRLSAASVIQPGQRLRVPGTGPAPAKPRSAASQGSVTRHTVRSGDTLSALAVHHHTTQAALLKLNHLRDADHLVVGQVLRIPVRAARAATTSASNTFAGRTYPDSTVAAANRNRAALRAAHLPSRTQIRSMIVSTARRHGVDPRLALAIGWQESGWNQSQVSVANAIGTMQVIPSSGEWASSMVGRRLNLLSTQDNITAGVAIIRSLTRSAKNVDQAIAGYYQGLGSVQSHGMYADTKQYVAAVKAHRARM